MEIDDDEDAGLLLLRGLIADVRLVATLDRAGEAFHYVSALTLKSNRPGVAVLWLDPVGLDHDLETPMAVPDPTSRIAPDADPDADAMEMVREIVARTNDHQLYRFWYLLTGLMHARLTEEQFRAALD